MSLTGTPAKIGDEWGGVRMKDPANPGDMVTVQTKSGSTFPRRLVSVHKQYPDAVVWVAEEVNGNAGPAPATAALSAYASPPAAPAGPASFFGTGPAGPVTTSSMVQAALSAYADAIAADWPAEQAGSLACTVAIQVGRGAVNDLLERSTP